MTKFLTFQLGAEDTAGVAVESIAEVFQVSLAEILPVPSVPGCVVGIYNWRGEMLWLVDLEHLFGYAPLTTATCHSTLMAVVIEKSGKSLGLLVRQLIDIEWLDIQQMKPPASELFSPEVLPFLQGYFIKDTEKNFILDASAIIQAPLWFSHYSLVIDN